MIAPMETHPNLIAKLATPSDRAAVIARLESRGAKALLCTLAGHAPRKAAAAAAKRALARQEA